MKKTKFSFHIGDCLQLCLFNDKLKNLFQVIDCSNLADHLGLANLILAVRTCLADDPNAVLLTEIMTWEALKPTVAEYVDYVLCCPLSMVPLLYGLRLANHVRLGKSYPHQLVSHCSKLHHLKVAKSRLSLRQHSNGISTYLL